jgi:phosphoenolpyruvate-protein kinase (PTS system EI component)
MVAMMITLVALLGLLQAVGMVTETNLRNQMRDEAVQIAEQQMNYLMSITDSGRQATEAARFANWSVASNLRGMKKKYRVAVMTKNTGQLSGSSILSRQIDVRVVWTYKNASTAHTVSSIKTFQ